MPRYSDERKEAVLRKMLPPHNRPLAALAAYLLKVFWFGDAPRLVQLWYAKFREYRPAQAEYLFDLCKTFAFIFTDKANHPIATCEDEQLRAARLMLAAAVGNTVKAGLGLLGIEVLEEM